MSDAPKKTDEEKPPIKRMTPAEFRSLGLLQEVNRRLLHPMGLALEVVHEGEEMRFGGVWDYRDDPEGIAFADQDIADEQSRQYVRNADELIEQHRAARVALFGGIIQPVPPITEGE